MRTFSARLKQARRDAGYTSAERFANTLGLEPHTYRKYERGESEPNFETLLRICELLSIEANYLLPTLGAKKSSQSGGGHNDQQPAA